MKSVKIADPEKYYQFLTAKSLDNQNEWHELVVLLTTIESYFMRDKGQFSLLKKVILPKLIEQKKSLHKTLGTKPTLRIWSAGCSTGEEPYSLAIILKQLIADWKQWTILILGTDINQKVIEKAQQGVYSPWSFRLVDPQVQKQYFSPRQIEWEINRELRESVEFRCLNLITDAFPNFYRNIYNIDLILCRNVFVYFEPEYISLVLKKFSKTLRPGGYLITGHAEVHGQIMNELKPEIFPESIVYQRREALPEKRYQNEPKSAPDQSENSGLINDTSWLVKGTMPASSAQGFSEIATLLTRSSSPEKVSQTPYLAGNSVSQNGSFLSSTISEKIPQKTYLMLSQEAKESLKKKLMLRLFTKQNNRYIFNLIILMLIIY
ncbi:protein-glutamate O-methyltransferase CheR [Tychonema sp. BBK16]|uniref:CheR family methyltransferase n=1 Tax=Tychonema sp. BBK16 TaxID=2699888 RepID=UPI001F17F463|nr:protein-glutamate O-methyltransferase CheR [Tychonema sp. BBK16]